jgi:hypothetical protein
MTCLLISIRNAGDRFCCGRLAMKMRGFCESLRTGLAPFQFWNAETMLLDNKTDKSHDFFDLVANYTTNVA